MTDKVFSPGEVLTAADVNNYLLNKTGSGNAIINGAFEINQRGFTSSTTNSAFGFDRWFAFMSGGTATQSAQTFSPGTAPLTNFEGSNFLRLTTSGQSAAADRLVIFQNIENVRLFANQTATLSFYAKAASGTPKIAAELSQIYGTAGSATENNFLGQATLSTSWQRFSFSFALPSLSGKTITSNSRLQLALWTSAGSDWNSRTNSLGIQNTEIDIWGVQLEAGSVATPFKRNANSLQGELAACQRYYFHNYPAGLFPGNELASGGFLPQTLVAQVPVTGTAGTNRGWSQKYTLPVEMRTTPTLRYFDFLGNQSRYSAADLNGSKIADNQTVDVFGNPSASSKHVIFQTVAASSTHIFSGIMFDASSEL